MKLKYLRGQILALVAVLSVSIASASDWKIVERSDKKVPEWVSSHSRGSILVTVEAPELEAAREQAVVLIQRQIVQAVATNVDFSLDQHSSESVADGQVSSLETMDAKTKVIAARLPYIKGVSISQATATYWEKLEDKKSRRTEYRLNVLYPLPESELEAMREQYDKEDADRQARLEALAAGIHEVRSMADVQTAVGELKVLQDFFPNATRREEAARLMKDYNSIAGRVVVEADQTGAGVCEVRVTYNGESFNAGGNVTVKSECANRIKVSLAENGCDWTITFSTEDCLDTEENFLDIRYRGKGVRKDIKLPISLSE